MATYIEILPDGTRREVKYDAHHGPVSDVLRLERKVNWLEKEMERRFINPDQLHHFKHLLHEARRKLIAHRQNVGQSKSSPLSEGAKARFQTNIRHTNPANEGSSGGETRAGTVPRSFPDNTAALSLQTGCVSWPNGCCCREVDRHGATSPAH